MNDDTISRQIAIDALFELYEYQRDIDPTEAADLVRQGIFLAEKKIEQLPSAERRGRWKQVGDDAYRCSVCGEISCCNSPFCSECGARMEGEEE